LLKRKIRAFGTQSQKGYLTKTKSPQKPRLQDKKEKKKYLV